MDPLQAPRPRRRLRAWALAAGLCAHAAWAAAQGPAPLELNLASQAELEQLPGLGPVVSERLLAERHRRGPFADWPALVRRVSGVGPATARRWSAAGLRIGGQAWPDEPAAAYSPKPSASSAQVLSGGVDQPKN